MSFLLRSFFLTLVTFVLLTPALAHATVLENPENGQHYSGIGVISGWKCSGGQLSVSLNDGALQIPLAYGTERRDVADAGLCGGHNYTGFIAIFNWARLGDGTHTAVVYDDGVEFARSTFTVGTLGAEFLTGAEASVIVRNFPVEGENQEFEWNQSTQHMEMVSPDWQPVEGTGFQSPEAVLGNPTHGLNYSGIGVVSGWKCHAGTLTYSVDGAQPIPLVYRMEREDVRETCGRSDVGFVAIQNWANFGAGEHTIVVYDDGEEFARSTFTVGHPELEPPFIEGASARVPVAGLPYAGQSENFEWNQNTQHLEVVGNPLVEPGPSFGSATIADQTYTQNTAITALPLPQATGGTAPLVYSLSPALPAGLSFNQTTRVLSGTPTSTLAATAYTYTVTDGTGATASLSFSLTVTGPPTAALSFGPATIADQRYTQNTALAPLTLPRATGGTAPLVYSLSPALPAGLSFNQSTRELSGTPTSTLAATTYTYSVTDATGATASLAFSLTVDPSGSGGGGGHDHGDTPQTATRVGLPSSTLGVHEVDGDEDYFRVEVTQSGTLTAEITGGAAHYSYAGILSSSGNSLAGAGAGFSKSLNASVTAGTYYVRVVAGSVFSTVGQSYTLVVSFTATPAPPPSSSDIHGDSRETATLVNYLISSIDGNLDTRGDVDYFRMEVPQRGIIVARTTGSTDTVGTLEYSSGSRIARSDDTRGQEEDNFLVWSAVSSGTYYVKVEGYGTGDYTLEVEWYVGTSTRVDITDSCNDGYDIYYRLFATAPRLGKLESPNPGVSSRVNWVTDGYGSEESVNIDCIQAQQVCFGGLDGDDYKYGIGRRLEGTGQGRGPCGRCDGSIDFVIECSDAWK